MATAGYESIKRWREKRKADGTYKAVRSAEAAKRRMAHREKIREYGRTWKREHSTAETRERNKLEKREYRKTDQYRRAQQVRHRKWRDRQDAILASIAGRPRSEVCELCGQKTKTVFDHCHADGHFRGWLCDRCNRVLGSVRDDVGLLLKLADYVTSGGFGHGQADSIKEKLFAERFVCVSEESEVPNKR